MKKVIIVLLITVLVAGFAFAGTLKGSAGIAFSVDLNDHEGADHAWGFKNTTSGKYTASFEFDSTKVAIGEDHQTEVWAELAAEASLTLKFSNQALSSGTAVDPKYVAKITKANIHVGEITFGILSAGSSADFAWSYYDDDEDGNPDYDFLPFDDAPLANGFTVSYKDFTGGFGAEGNWGAEGNADDNVFAVFAHVETPEFKFVDDQVTVEGGAYAFLTDKTTDASVFGGAVKGAYAADKLSASVAADLAYVAAQKQFAFEAAASAKYDFVALDIYAVPGKLAGYLDDAIKLDARVTASYNFDLTDEIALAVTGYADARDILVKDLILAVGSTQGTSVDAFAFTLSEDAVVGNIADKEEAVEIYLDIAAKVAYTHDKFTAYAKLAPKFLFDKDAATDTFYSLGLEAGASSDVIVEGASLALTYKSANLVKFSAHRGVVSASCTINF